MTPDPNGAMSRIEISDQWEAREALPSKLQHVTNWLRACQPPDYAQRIQMLAHKRGPQVQNVLVPPTRRKKGASTSMGVAGKAVLNMHDKRRCSYRRSRAHARLARRPRTPHVCSRAGAACAGTQSMLLHASNCFVHVSHGQNDLFYSF